MRHYRIRLLSDVVTTSRASRCGCIRRHGGRYLRSSLWKRSQGIRCRWLRRINACRQARPTSQRNPLRPGRPAVVKAMTKQKSAELLARLPQAAHSGKPCPNQITHRLMGYIGYPNSAQFSSAMKSCQIVASRRSVLMLYMRLYEGISKWRGQRRAHRASRLSARPRPDLPANIPQ